MVKVPAQVTQVSDWYTWACRDCEATGAGRGFARQPPNFQVRASGKGDTEGSEPGRLVQDALEFNKQGAGTRQSARAPVQQQEHQVGDLLGSKYQVVELLAKGKSGLVYKVSRYLFTILQQITSALQNYSQTFVALASLSG